MTEIHILVSELYGTSKRIVILNFPCQREFVEKMVNEAARDENQKGDWKVLEVRTDS
jgi:hypothetical protein